MKATKKEYEEYLNEIGVPSHDNYELGGRCRSKNYGSWLRKNDPIAFEVGFNEYKDCTGVRFMKKEIIDDYTNNMDRVDCIKYLERLGMTKRLLQALSLGSLREAVYINALDEEAEDFCNE